MANSAWISNVVASFGAACKAKLSGPGDREAAIRSPIEQLISRTAEELGLTAVPHDEVRDTERRVRPDYAISVEGVVCGYIEVKKPESNIDPGKFTGHNLQQWQRQRDLPNLIYTNGTEWRLYRDGEPIGEPVQLTGGSLAEYGDALTAPPSFETLLTEFLRWSPSPITSVRELVRSVAPLTRLLRGEVLDQLEAERRAITLGADEYSQPFQGLARDWRSLLFPEATDDVFADGYAQTVTFGLLLARSEGIDVASSNFHEVGKELGHSHSLMGRALQLLTEVTARDFTVTLGLLLRVIGSVQWERVRAGKRDLYLYLYEHFLEEYDPEKRKQSGSYYTPREVVDQMIRMVDDLLRERLGKADGFADPSVLTVDPAMGTGTYLHGIIETVAERVKERDGEGAATEVVTDLAHRIVGFELQMGPYTVAELRTTDLLKRHKAKAPTGGMRTYVTNTLDDPFEAIDVLSSQLAVISASRRKANKIKTDTPVTVVIGNPPYRERAEGMGGWVEQGLVRDRGTKNPANELDAFRAPKNGRVEFVLKNLYVYFWRWATWKVFDQPAGDRSGIVCFITTSGYLRGAGFKGMREYLRRTASEGWIINVSPEGMRPDVATRVFPGVQQPLAIGIFVRSIDTEPDSAAIIRYAEISGRQEEKYRQLAAINLFDEEQWRHARTDWRAPLTPAADSDWDDWPALDDLMPWRAPGVKPNRTWVYAPHPSILADRWRTLTSETDPERKKKLFKESDSARLDKAKEPLPGDDTHKNSSPFNDETGEPPSPVRVGFRSFDRQWIIPDRRLLHRESPTLWAARQQGQIFTIEQNAHEISTGPGVVFTHEIPDMHHFNNRGGRALPMLHPDGTANLAPGFARSWAEAVLHRETKVTAHEFSAYLAGVVSNPAFTEYFSDELTTPGIRVPLTLDKELWREAVKIGEEVLWLHTYGATFADPPAGRPANNIRYPNGDPRQPKSLSSPSVMPSEMKYDEERRELHLGSGVWGPVNAEVWNYQVGSRPVIKSWFNYRKSDPGGLKTSPLDDLHLDEWPLDWTRELNDLLTVLTRLVELHERQADLLNRIVQEKIATKAYLSRIGVIWPTAEKDRKPRYSQSFEEKEGLLPGF
ncbi:MULTISPECIES: type ISP restriction/modification enzyme [Streptomyces]|uniref:site-specific DNA-methyltransferase (adenine-specific) n=1 Tax=Streptomyces galilaeus TaxID=33899 RepID=A0ABW9IXC7_STRGJ